MPRLTSDRSKGVTLVIRVHGGSDAFHRVVGVLHRKRVRISAVTFVGDTLVVGVDPGVRSVDSIVAAIERDPVVAMVSPAVGGGFRRVAVEVLHTMDEDEAGSLHEPRPT